MSQSTRLPVSRAISVCVDDFGQHEGINQAALELATRGRVSALSCLVDGPAWSTGAQALRTESVAAEVGLHLNFTEDFGQGGCLPLGILIARCYARLLDRAAIRRAIERQFDRFEAAMGRLPAFVDGHQHVHQLPVIRDVLIEVMDRRCGAARPWLRATLPPAACRRAGLSRATALKSWLIARLGARPLARIARRHGYRQNGHLVGAYGFEPSEADYLVKLRHWLACAGDGDVLMCHPSLPWEGADPLRAVRAMEYRVLAGEEFSALLKATGIVVGPLSC